tara:strand:- start:3641 stop:3742 length:102 start_codon:yes stop_codon:yes gene_type:complete
MFHGNKYAKNGGQMQLEFAATYAIWKYLFLFIY